jgi:Polyketide cyclase / dehydrase and lipid transport
VELDHAAPLVFIIASALVILPLLIVTFGPFPRTRVDLDRSVLVHAASQRVWEFVGSVPTLHGAHGRFKDFGRVTGWSLRHGDGRSAGSVWRALGTWGAVPYWADIEILRIDPGREIAVRLRHDSLGTQRGLRDHVGSLVLESIEPGATKISWRLGARLRGPRLRVAHLLSSRRLRARLLDQGLRSLKVEIDTATKDPEGPASVRAGDTGTLGVPPPPRRIPPETTV